MPAFGIHAHNNNDNALAKSNEAICHGCKFVDVCIGGLGRGAGNLRAEQWLCQDFARHGLRQELILGILNFYNDHIMSKFQHKNVFGAFHHPYYTLSGALSLHPDYIAEILADVDSPVRADLAMIGLLDAHTKLIDFRNYDKGLIGTLRKKKMIA